MSEATSRGESVWCAIHASDYVEKQEVFLEAAGSTGTIYMYEWRVSISCVSLSEAWWLSRGCDIIPARLGHGRRLKIGANFS